MIRRPRASLKDGEHTWKDALRCPWKGLSSTYSTLSNRKACLWYFIFLSAFVAPLTPPVCCSTGQSNRQPCQPSSRHCPPASFPRNHDAGKRMSWALADCHPRWRSQSCAVRFLERDDGRSWPHQTLDAAASSYLNKASEVLHYYYIKFFMMILNSVWKEKKLEEYNKCSLEECGPSDASQVHVTDWGSPPSPREQNKATSSMETARLSTCLLNAAFNEETCRACYNIASSYSLLHWNY